MLNEGLSAPVVLEIENPISAVANQNLHAVSEPAGSSRAVESEEEVVEVLGRYRSNRGSVTRQSRNARSSSIQMQLAALDISNAAAAADVTSELHGHILASFGEHAPP